MWKLLSRFTRIWKTEEKNEINNLNNAGKVTFYFELIYIFWSIMILISKIKYITLKKKDKTCANNVKNYGFNFFFLIPRGMKKTWTWTLHSHNEINKYNVFQDWLYICYSINCEILLLASYVYVFGRKKIH